MISVAIVPLEFISEDGNYLLYPLHNNFEEDLDKYNGSGPVFNNLKHWTVEDYRNVLPITTDKFKLGLFSEYPIHHFYLLGCCGM